MRIVSVEQMRALEQATFAAGTSEAELQARAGRAVALAVLELCPDGRSVAALVGPGNNGRDAWIAATTLLERSWAAALYLTPRHAVTAAELRAFVDAGGSLIWHTDVDPDLAVRAAVSRCDVVIDGLLGIGSRGAPRPPLDAIIGALNACHAGAERPLVVAVDTPSGLDADTGEAAGVAVRADATVVLGAAKRGLLRPEALAWTGALHFANIGIVDGPAEAAELIDLPSLRGRLPPRPPDAHKGTFGRLLVVAGSERFVGAAYLTCAAAVRAGAGVVTLAAPPWLRNAIAPRLAEITYLPLPDAGLAGAPEESARRIMAELDGCDALALGPGLSMEGGVTGAVELVLRERARRALPAVVDADGLNALARLPEWPSWIGEGVVLTPHPGELRRLTMGGPGAEVGPVWERARALGAQWGVVLLIKGPFTSIGASGRAWVHVGPNPVLATAGTGDVLTGIIAGLLARGIEPVVAARLGAWAHGQAGRVLASGKTAGGLLASELLGELPGVLAQVVDARPTTSGGL